MSGFKAYVYLTFHFVINKSLIKFKKDIIYFTKKMPVTCVLTTKSFSKIKKIFHSRLYFSFIKWFQLKPSFNFSETLENRFD